ncbi:hypothetical protein KC361_g251 [Hortaea werneckii]|nr:hypothetical protein KC361_g251 [Hortaea werneckii]
MVVLVLHTHFLPSLLASFLPSVPRASTLLLDLGRRWQRAVATTLPFQMSRSATHLHDKSDGIASERDRRNNQTHYSLSLYDVRREAAGLIGSGKVLTPVTAPASPSFLPVSPETLWRVPRTDASPGPS